MTDRPDDLPPNWQQIDALDGYHLGIADAKARVAAGEPVPEWLRPAREDAE